MFVKIDAEIHTLRDFLVERSVPSRQELENALTGLSASENRLGTRLSELTHTLKGVSDVAEELRTELSQIENEIKKLAVAKRDRDKLLKRLLPLRGQYSEDVKKLQFLQETEPFLTPLDSSGALVASRCFKRRSSTQVCSLWSPDSNAAPRILQHRQRNQNC